MEEENNQLIEISTETNSVVLNAEQITISCQEDLEGAVSFMTKIKNAQKNVEEYWKEPKKKASEAHKNICAKEKEMLEPLKNSEQIIKLKISVYNDEQRHIALEEEKRIKEEQDRLALEELKRAEQLKEQGELVEAQIVEENAIAISEIETKVDTKIEKVSGLSFRKDYQINILDEKKVPAYINGIEIRKIDLQQIKKIIKMTNNGIKIDGVNVKEIQIPISR